MRAEKNPTYSCIFKKAREKHISMEKLAAACGLSRSTLYRYMKGLNNNWADIEQLLVKALQLTYTEQQELARTLPKDDDPSLFSAAYPILDKLLSGGITDMAESPMDFVYLANDEKYLRSAVEMVAAIRQSVDTNETTVTMKIVGCTGSAFFPFVNQLLSELFQASVSMNVEHLLNIPTENEQYAAQVFCATFSLLKYQKYEIFYSESMPIQDDQTPYHNHISIKLSSGPSGQEKPTFYFITLSANALSQCIQCREKAVYDFFCANFNVEKQNYKSTLMLSKNLSNLGEQLSDFETNGTICLFKPDFCYNHIPTEVYQRLFNRMTQSELADIVTVANGSPVSEADQPQFLQALLSVMARRYKATKQNPGYLVCSREKLESFTKTGLLDDMTFPFPPFTPEERILILKDLHKRVVTKNDMLKMIMLPHTVFPSKEVISVNQRRGILINFGGNSRHGLCRNVLIENQLLCDIFTGYAKHMYSDQQFYTPDGCAKALEKLINSLE